MTVTINGSGTGCFTDASGNVGIGTSSPGFKLEIVGGTNNGVHIKDAASATVFGGLFTQASNMALVTRSNHALTFGTNDAERMRIDTSGNVGIGTTSPSFKLDVVSSVDTFSAVRSTGTIQSSIFSITGRQSSVDETWNIISSGSGLGGGALRFTRGSWTDSPAMLINSSGNVGVGTTSPTAKITAYSGGANATTYNTMIAAGGGSTATIQNQGTTSVSTSATVILTSGQYGSFCLVFGSDGTNRFMDVVLFGLGTGTVNVISSLSVAGSPSARTYSQSASTYRLAMASGTYTVQVSAFTMSG